MGNHLGEGIREAVLVLLVLILWWIALRGKGILYRKIEARRGEGKRALDPFTLEILGKVFTVFIFFTSLMFLFQIFGIDMIPLVTLSGIGAAILGFASRDVIANFFGGLMIYITRPFSVHDFIEIPGKKIAGKVEEIGWYLTTVRDLQKKSLYVPNSVFSTELLFNNSRMTHRRIEEKLRFRISDPEKLRFLTEQIRILVRQTPEIDRNESVEVFLLYISPWGAEIELKAYTKTTNYLKFMHIKEDLLFRVSRLSSDQAVDGRT